MERGLNLLAKTQGEVRGNYGGVTLEEHKLHLCNTDFPAGQSKGEMCNQVLQTLSLFGIRGIKP